MGRKAAPDGSRMGESGARGGRAALSLGQRLCGADQGELRVRSVHSPVHAGSSRTAAALSTDYFGRQNTRTPVSPYGLYQTIGNVAEWVADWYDQDYYKTAPDRNPLGPETGTQKAFRGGGWMDKLRRCGSPCGTGLNPERRSTGWDSAVHGMPEGLEGSRRGNKAAGGTRRVWADNRQGRGARRGTHDRTYVEEYGSQGDGAESLGPQNEARCFCGRLSRMGLHCSNVGKWEYS